MKRLVVCCDGTWQNLASAYPSNVVKLSQSVLPFDKNGVPQIVYYDQGIGTEHLKILGGATGLGIDENIQDCYRFLCLNYVDGDEIYMFGFSRGAYTVRSLAGMIYCSGLLRRRYITQAPQAYELYRQRDIKPSDKRAVKYREKFGKNNGKPVNIKLVGCFDTVGALGVPVLPMFKMLSPQLHRRYKFHDTTLNKCVENALHAMAIDEIREVFDVTRMTKNPDAENQRVIEKWFPGEHGCVGGGTEAYSPLSDAVLKWMVDAMQELGLGLEVDVDHIEENIKPNPLIDFMNSPGFFKLAGIKFREIGDAIDELHETTLERLKSRQDYRPNNLQKIISKLNLDGSNNG